MGVPTVAELCAAVPSSLATVTGFAAPDLEVSAVHVSELADPTAYLSGGELLLTTGLPLPDNEIGCERYVSRLVSAGVSALGIGLGPSLSAIPDALADACAKHGLCLLAVPPAAAFLTISKAYWASRSHSNELELTDAITAHRSLVDAMVSGDPVGATLKALSRTTGAWVARLDPLGAVEHVFPSGRVADAMGVAEQISALRVAGMHSSATFPLGGDVVAVFPLPLEDRVVGYLAVGSRAPLEPTARRLVLTAGALLSLDSVQRQRADAAHQSQMQAVASLLDMGFVEPARRLASRMALPAPGDSLRVLVVRTRRPADTTEAVRTWMPTTMPGPADGNRVWFLVPEAHPPVGRLVELLRTVDPLTTALLSDTVAPPSIHAVRVGLFDRVISMPDGTIGNPQERSPDDLDLHAGIHRVLDYSRADLAETLVAYLRNRGQWDATAREVGVHRNTVRHRLGTIRSLLGADPDDPDVTARTWLYLRENGLA